MKLATVLRKISSNYYFHVYHSTFVDGGYRLDTNYGPKRVSIWTDQSILEWSCHWREILVKKGYRQIDRFIRTQDGAAYVEDQSEYIVVQDVFQGEVVDITQPNLLKHLGHFVGEWFQACQEAFHKVMEKGQHDHWQRNGEKEINKERLYGFKKRIMASEETMFSYLALHHWNSIERRWKQAVALQQVSHSSRTERMLPFSLHLEQWLTLEQGYIGFYVQEQKVSYDYRSLAQFMQDLYIKRNCSLEEMETFYEAFCLTYNPDMGTHYNILAHLIDPHSFLEILSKYMDQGYSDEECAELWMEQCHLQDKLDEVHLWLASYLDRGRQETELG